MKINILKEEGAFPTVKEINQDSITLRIKGRLLDIEKMIEYATSRGENVSREKLEDLQRLYKTVDYQGDHIGDGNPVPDGEIDSYLNLYAEVTDFYKYMHTLIDPVSARSLSATEQKGLGLFYRIKTINFITGATIISLIALIFLSINYGKNEISADKPVENPITDPIVSQVDSANSIGISSVEDLSNTGSSSSEANSINTKEPSSSESYPTILIYLRLLAASILGAGFSILYNVKKYIVERTYEVRYNQGYMVNFIIGSIAGMILSFIFYEILGEQPDQKLPINIGMTVIAIVGGYSAEAVVRILERIAETLEAFVSGGNATRVDQEVDLVKGEERNKKISLIQDIKANKNNIDFDQYLDSLINELLKKKPK